MALSVCHSFCLSICHKIVKLEKILIQHICLFINYLCMSNWINVSFFSFFLQLWMVSETFTFNLFYFSYDFVIHVSNHLKINWHEHLCTCLPWMFRECFYESNQIIHLNSIAGITLLTQRHVRGIVYTPVFNYVKNYWSHCCSGYGVCLAIERSRVQYPMWECSWDFPHRHQVLVLVPGNRLESVSN